MANYYWRNTGDTRMNITTNWSLTDGGGSAGVVPTSSDNVFFTATGGNALTSITWTFASMNFTGYTGTFTISIGTNVNVAGDITLSAAMTFVTLGTGIFIITANSTITTNGKAFLALQLSGANTFTLADTLNVSGIFTLSGTATFAGTSGFTVGTLTYSSGIGTQTQTLKAGVTYRTNTLTLTASTTGVAHSTIKSDTAGVKANLIVSGVCNVSYADFTDIDASGGRTIGTFNGVLTNTTNIVTVTDFATSESTIASSSLF